MTPNPIDGTTENITLNGVRVGSLAHPAQPGMWHDAVRDDVELTVEVTFPEIPDFPPLRGRIVWVFKESGGKESKARGSVEERCAVGVLFSILRDGEQKALQGLIEKLSAPH